MIPHAAQAAILLVSLALIANGVAAEPDETPRQQAIRLIYSAAVADPGYAPAFEAFKATLPDDGRGNVIVEGDILLTPGELRAYLEDLGARPTADDRTRAGELILATHNGRPSFWPSGRRTLTYWLDRASFGNNARANQVQEEMKQATAAWHDACDECDVKFVEVDGQAAAGFTVRYVPGSRPIARAFFPHSAPARRFVEVFDPYFQPSLGFDRVGVLRHELGHVLGYRHEHTRGVNGCFFEDNRWIALTPYDSKSVMHYLCGGAGDRNLELTRNDRAGHRCVYSGDGPPCEATPAQPAHAEPQEHRENVTIRFTGRNVADHWARLVAALVEESRAAGNEDLVQKVPLRGRSSLCEVYQEELGLPGCSRAVQELAADLNPGVLQKDGEVMVPNVPLAERHWGRVFDTEDEDEDYQLQDFQARWSHVEFEPYEKGEVVRVVVPGYEVEANVTETQADQLEEIFYDQKIPNANMTRPIERIDLFAHLPADKHAAACRNGVVPKEDRGAYSLMLGATPRDPSCTNDCPVVFVVDTKVYAHPSIEPALLTEGRSEVGAAPADGTCPYVAEFDVDDHHGSHLAGIIAGRDVEDGQFIGLAPEALLYNVIWEDGADQREFASEMVKLIESEPGTADRPRVWVFASRFPYNSREVLANAQDRFKTPAAAVDIVNERPLWITAIGQAEPRQTIERTTPWSPMNLGDLRNVVVVSACDPCLGPDAKLWEEANVVADPDLLHVAAPGGSPVPGIATNLRYAEAVGTSQAAAFVGGLAAAMIAEHSDAYGEGQHPHLVKLRLQVTATPIVHEDDKIATGVVNPNLALCDPRKHWFQEAGQFPGDEVTCASTHVALQKIEWCRGIVELNELTASHEDAMVSVSKRIHRVVKTSPQDERDRWVIYEHHPNHRVGSSHHKSKARVTKHGPGALRPGVASAPLARLTWSDGRQRVVTLAEVQDLVLARVVEDVVSCST